MERIYQKHDTQHVAATMLYVNSGPNNTSPRFHYDRDCTKGVTGKELMELFFTGTCVVYDPYDNKFGLLIEVIQANGGACARYGYGDQGYSIDYQYAD